MGIHAFSASRNIVGRIGAILMMSCAPSMPGATEIRTAAQDASEPKFVALIEKGKSEVGGLCVDIMRAIERVDPTLKFVGDQIWQPLLRIEAGVSAGHLDACCGLLRAKSREAKYVYIEPPLFQVNYHLVARADDDVQINNWNDVRKLGSQGVILVINGFGIIRKLEEEGDLKIDAGAYTSKANFDKLLAGRGRFYYHRSPGIKSEIRNAGVANKVKILPAVMHSEQFYMVLSKTVAAETVEKIRKAIAVLEKNGELKRILEKWDSY
jgi:polar amino acid transport system substrate-binding protein